MPSTKDVFVIMPFSDTTSCTEAGWTETFEHVFRPAVQDCGYSCERAAPTRGNVIVSIVERLHKAHIVVADVTDRNPNVFYELGVRHSLSKRTIIVTQRAADIPSDLRGYWWIEYGRNPGQVAQFGRDIRRLISEIEANPEKSDSPVTDYIEREGMSAFKGVGSDTDVVKTMFKYLAEEHSLLLELTAFFKEASSPQEIKTKDAELLAKWVNSHNSGLNYFRTHRILFSKSVSEQIQRFLTQAHGVYVDYTSHDLFDLSDLTPQDRMEVHNLKREAGKATRGSLQEVLRQIEHEFRRLLGVPEKI